MGRDSWAIYEDYVRERQGRKSSILRQHLGPGM